MAILFMLISSLAVTIPSILTKEIRLCVLLPMTGRWPIGTRIAAAVPMAIHDVMLDSTLLPGYNFTYQIVDSACEPEKGLRGMVKFQAFDLFIGPGCSVVAEPAALLAKIWNKPIVTYAASSNKFINKDVYSTLGTITAYARRSERYTPTFVLQILKAFNWTIFAILSSSEVEWITMAGKIRSAVEPSVKVSLFENYDNKQPEFARVLQKGKEVSRVFLILCYINEVLAIMKEAQSLGMTNGEYAFITLDMNTDVFYKDGQWTGNQGSGSKFPDELTGIIDLSVYRPGLSEEFKMTYKEKEDTLEPSIKTILYHKVINLVNDLHSLYDTVMARYDVYKVETSSDSYLVVSGLPERNGNKHTEQIASMSLHLVAYLRGYKISHLQGMTLQFRIGIHSGPCVAGVVGLKKPRYDIFGETVNIAKQLEETGTAQNIHVSSSCKLILDDLPGGFHVEERGLMNVKGLGETTTFYLIGKVPSSKPSLQ